VLVQLLYFPGCPHVEAARRVLRQVLGTMEALPEVIEVDVTAPDVPENLRGWGSPTILVDGVDVTNGAPSGAACRLYPSSETRGVPPADLIKAALQQR
jgi:hypothetical protein